MKKLILIASALIFSSAVSFAQPSPPPEEGAPPAHAKHGKKNKKKHVKHPMNMKKPKGPTEPANPKAESPAETTGPTQPE